MSTKQSVLFLSKTTLFFVYFISLFFFISYIYENYIFSVGSLTYLLKLLALLQNTIWRIVYYFLIGLCSSH